MTAPAPRWISWSGCRWTRRQSGACCTFSCSTARPTSCGTHGGPCWRHPYARLRTRWSAACATSSVEQVSRISKGFRCSSCASMAAWACEASTKTSRQLRACRPQPSPTLRWQRDVTRLCPSEVQWGSRHTGVLGPGGPLQLVWDDLFREFSVSEHASAVLLATFPSPLTHVVAATACLVPFLLNPAASLGRSHPWRMKLHWLALVEAFLLGVSTAASTRLPPSESVLASLHLPAWSSVHS